MMDATVKPLHSHRLLIELSFDAFLEFPQKRRERGRIDVRGVKLVEPAILHGDGGDAAAPNVSED